jgi:hypothetical protein
MFEQSAIPLLPKGLKTLLAIRDPAFWLCEKLFSH